MAIDLGVYEQVRGPTPLDELSDDAKKPIDFYKKATGQLNILDERLLERLPTLQIRKTRSDYRKAVEVLSRHFAIAEEQDRYKCGNFLMHIGEQEGVGGESVKKWRSTYLSFWEFMGKENSIWRGHDIRSQTSIHKVPWPDEEVWMLYEKAEEEEHWVQHAIWIAAHTGARESGHKQASV